MMTFQIKFYLYKNSTYGREQNSMNMPEKRLKQKKRLYLHFVLLFLASLFCFSTKLFNFGLDSNWYIYAITLVFYFILHFIKVFITDRFMNKTGKRTN
jgi:membrane protein YdbS with pleckstrin-like domain